MKEPDLTSYPLCKYFLERYLSRVEDPLNFPPDDPTLFERYEALFGRSLQILQLTKESLKAKQEFRFDSGDPGNLEGALALLRVVQSLHDSGYHSISLAEKPSKGGGADIVCADKQQKVCVEVKAITKQSGGNPELFLEDQIYEKIRDAAAKATKQLEATAVKLNCGVKIFACVLNWLTHSVCLPPDSYCEIANKLENDPCCLDGVDRVLFVTSTGQTLWLFQADPSSGA